ncbi:MAG: hypothetical protein AB7F36_14390 [Reyranellaceae bacterium]
MNWLERARRELREIARRRTADTAERPPTSVSAVRAAADSDPKSTEALREAWEERAAILEYDGGLARDEAECVATVSIYGSTRLH